MDTILADLVAQFKMTLPDAYASGRLYPGSQKLGDDAVPSVRFIPVRTYIVGHDVPSPVVAPIPA